MRSGTMNAPAAKAFAMASEIAVRTLDEERARLAGIKKSLVEKAKTINSSLGHTAGNADTLPNIVHFTLAGGSGDSLLFLLDQDGISVSTGSACQAGVNRPSHVLIAMGRTEDEAKGCLRITLGHESTESDIEALLTSLPKAIDATLRAGLSSQ
jgi:cysteine desulfurase